MQSQQALAFPYYDPVPPHGLHMTIDRIAPEGVITPAQLNAVTAAARLACQEIAPFRISSATSAAPSASLPRPSRR